MTRKSPYILAFLCCLSIYVLAVAGCSNSALDEQPRAVAAPAPNGVTVTLRHVGAVEVQAQAVLDLTVGTGIPEEVTTFRVTGLDDGGTVLYPAQTFPRAEVIPVAGVPKAVTRLLIQYLDADGTVLARHLRKVVLTSDTTLQIADTDVHRHLTQTLPSTVPCLPPGVDGLFDDWTPLFQGISSSQAQFNVAFGDCKTQRTQVVHALRIDLSDPDIRFVTTPALAGKPGYTQAQIATDFLLEHQNDPGKLPVQVAVNSNFFTPCCDTQAGGNVSSTVQLRGLSISEGTPVNPEDLNVATADDPGAVSALFSRNQVLPGYIASFEIITDSTDPSVWSGVDTAVAAGNGNPGAPKPVTQFLVRAGLLEPDPTPPKTVVAARTGLGFSSELPPRFMYIVTVDGMEGTSFGAANFDTACWLLLAGAWDGINMDGGGSTTLAFANNGEAQLIGVPHGDEKTKCLQRLVGSVLGIRAKPVSNQVLPPMLACPPQP